MNRSEEIEKSVKLIVAKQLSINESSILNEHSFLGDLGADSLDTVELLMNLEQDLGIEIGDLDAENMTTVQSVIDFAIKHKK